MNAERDIDLSVIVPAFNEGPNLGELAQRLLFVFESLKLKGEIIVIDDGSSDETSEILSELAERFHGLRVLRNSSNQGILVSLKNGVSESAAPLIATIDADLQYRPEDLIRLYRELKYSNADMVCGWRSPIGKRSGKHGWENRMFRFLLRCLFGISLRDSRTGFLIAHRNVLTEVLAEHKDETFFQAFLASIAILRGYRVVEVEVWWEERKVGINRFAKLSPSILIPLFVDAFHVWKRNRLRPRRKWPLEDLLKDAPIDRQLAEDWPLWRRLVFKIYLLTFPLHHWMITGRCGSLYWQFRRTQWASPKRIREYQEERLRTLVRHAYRRVPYYRVRMDQAGVSPFEINTLDDLRRLPLLSKEDIRQNIYFDLLADNHQKEEISRVNTSGSTGEPMVIYADRLQLELRWAATLRGQEWAGYRFGDRCARLWHQTIGMSRSQILREKADAFFTRRLFIPAFELSDSSIQKFVSELKRWKPSFIDGYAESLNFLASYLTQSDLEEIRPRGIMSSAQTLPQRSRQIIERAFGCKVFDKYGSREFSGIAYECDHHAGHHIVSELYIVEVLKDGQPCPPGEVGEVVITDLINYSMPLIRYRLGDLATALDNRQACSCGRGAPRIGEIQGRTQAIVLGTHGKYLPGTFFAHFFKDFDHVVRQYQIIQEEKGALTLVIVKGTRFSQPALDDIVAKLREFVGHDMAISIEFAERIEMVRTGKHRAIVSNIGLDFQDSGGTAMMDKSPSS